MPIVCVIHTIHIMRHPAGISFDADYFQLGMALENSAEDEGPDDVLASADDRHEAVELRPARLEVVAAAGQDVKAQRHLEIDRGFIEGRVNRTVVVVDGGVNR